MSSAQITAENASLFEIDKELEAAFEEASQEQEQAGAISDERNSAASICLLSWGRRLTALPDMSAPPSLRPGPQKKKRFAWRPARRARRIAWRRLKACLPTTCCRVD